MANSKSYFTHYRLLQQQLKIMKSQGLVAKSFKCNQKQAVLQAEYERALLVEDAQRKQSANYSNWEEKAKKRYEEKVKREWDRRMQSFMNAKYEMPVGDEWDTDYRTARNRGYCEAEAKNCADILKNQPTSKIAQRIKESIYA